MAAYHRPETLEDALDYLSGTRATIAAGCTDLFPATARRALDGPVLDVTGITALRGITRAPDHIRIGATTTWTDILRADLPPACDMLKQAAAEVGSAQIQNAGTIAGNICNASPAADGVPCLLALDAMVELTSAAGPRRLPLADFITGPRQTARRADELVTALHLPATAGQGQSRFLKLGARAYLVISIAMVAARIELEKGRVRNSAIAIGACGPVAARLPALEAALIGQPAGALTGIATDALIAPAIQPIDDMRADAPYRAHAAAELVRRALADLTGTARGQAA